MDILLYNNVYLLVEVALPHDLYTFVLQYIYNSSAWKTACYELIL